MTDESKASTAKRGSRAGGRRKKRKSKPPRLWLRVMRRAAIVVGLAATVPALGVPLFHFGTPVSTVMIWDRISGENWRRDWVPLDAISPHLIRAVISSEDNFYCRHHGVDWGAVREVLETGADRGASTIAMQTARNLMLWQGRSYVRKALEVPLAFYADLVLGKRRLMEIYLNIAEWGPGIYGIEAAARHHFGVAAADLTLRQATLLAVTLPSPLTRDPARPSDTMERLATIITGRVADGVGTECLGF